MRFSELGKWSSWVFFGLVAVESSRAGAWSQKGPGVLCALVAFGVQWDFLDALLASGNLGRWTAARLATIPSGWTNIFLAITVWNQWARPSARTTRWLCLATVATIPSSWLLMAEEGLRPREGHAAWLIGMALMLCCRPIAEAVRRVNSPLTAHRS